MGHPAAAITDHANVQSFMATIGLRKLIKAIFGLEANLNEHKFLLFIIPRIWN